MNEQEALAALAGIKTQNEKALGEIRGKLDELLLTITDLEAAIANQSVPQSIADAIAAVGVSSQALDDVVPDAPPTPP